MIKAVIIENEPLAAMELKEALGTVAPGIAVVALLTSVMEAQEKLPKLDYELLFMDVNLGDGLSFDIIERLGVTAPVIYITAYDQYPLTAFRSNGMDYLLKPFSHEDLRRSIDKLYSTARLLPGPAAGGTDISDGIRGRFLVTSGDKLRSIPVGEISYFMTTGKYLHLVTRSGEDYLIEGTLSSTVTLLPAEDFFRVNRKYIVSFPSIVEMVRYSGKRIKLVLSPPPQDTSPVIVSGDRVNDFLRWLSK